MLLGLRVNGLTVIGLPLEESDRKRQSVKMKWLKDHYNALKLDDNSPDEVKLWKTRMYLLLLFANLLFPNTNGNAIHIKFLPLSADINKIGRYSWGTATLAHL